MNTKQFFTKAKEQIIFVFNSVKSFIESSKLKLHNLYQTNYDTGMYHLDHGNLWDATFRFKVIKKYWPNELKPQYLYAYCLVLQNMNNDAKRVLTEILEKDPNYKEASELLDKINSNNTKEIVTTYNEKFKKTQENTTQDEQKENK